MSFNLDIKRRTKDVKRFSYKYVVDNNMWTNNNNNSTIQFMHIIYDKNDGHWVFFIFYRVEIIGHSTDFTCILLIIEIIKRNDKSSHFHQ